MMNKFDFLSNFKEMADKLSDEMRLKFYDALTDYVFKGVKPEDVIISALIAGIKPFLENKVSVWGGVREGSGRKRQNQDELEKLEKNQDELEKNQKEKERKKNSPLTIPQEEINKNKNILYTPAILTYSCPLPDKPDEFSFMDGQKGIPPDVIKKQFEEFWATYTPVKTSDGRIVGKGSKEQSQKKFISILKGGENYENILAGVQRYIAFCRSNDQLTCSVPVFLGQKRWLDDDNFQTVSAERTERQRPKPSSVLAPYAELIAEYSH